MQIPKVAQSPVLGYVSLVILGAELAWFLLFRFLANELYGAHNPLALVPTLALVVGIPFLILSVLIVAIAALLLSESRGRLLAIVALVMQFVLAVPIFRFLQEGGVFG